MARFVTRFAPSPTGYLHLGHAYSAWQVREAADRAGGDALLRIEDTDLGRCRPDYDEAIIDDLAWLGLSWDGETRRQSQHFPEYAAVITDLRNRGLVYRCFRSRAEIRQLTASPAIRPYVSTALPRAEEAARLRAGKPFAWRLSLARAREALGPAYEALTFTVETEAGTRTMAAEPDRHGDIALSRKDSPAAYHLAACHDDALQGVSHVIRGEDLAEAAHIHTLLQALMDWPRPVYRHHGLLIGPDGKRLAKRFKSRTIRAMRAAGYSPDDIYRRAMTAQMCS